MDRSLRGRTAKTRLQTDWDNIRLSIYLFNQLFLTAILSSMAWSGIHANLHKIVMFPALLESADIFKGLKFKYKHELYIITYM